MTDCYESVFVIRPEVPEDKVKELADRFMTMVQKKGGRLLETKILGQKILAYRVGKHTRGTYVQTRFEGGGPSVDELERNLRISEDVIRFLTVREKAERKVKLPKHRRKGSDGT